MQQAIPRIVSISTILAQLPQFSAPARWRDKAGDNFSTNHSPIQYSIYLTFKEAPPRRLSSHKDGGEASARPLAREGARRTSRPFTAPGALPSANPPSQRARASSFRGVEIEARLAVTKSWWFATSNGARSASVMRRAIRSASSVSEIPVSRSVNSSPPMRATPICASLASMRATESLMRTMLTKGSRRNNSRFSCRRDGVVPPG